ncbi:zinc finger BED domain-containing protein RICESLEEPER 2-like [Neltuma alba]|uniref:zinc finger BED domain-containing protein RICESLEEPER 2-like n=2 Tax=Neltuma alba TaxID=207710 RepID=UPI0010A5249A|nr:zinc finger BED domain-containing protein RICESLEEPER 2-like [Prosopis alba]
MSSPFESETMSSNSVPSNAIVASQQTPTDSSQQTNEGNDVNDSIIQKKRRKTSTIWEEFDQVETDNGIKGKCKYCKQLFSYSGKGASTSHLRRHVTVCLQRKLLVSSQSKQPTIPFQSSNLSINPFLTPGARYSNEKMREIIATAIMVHEHPFNIVEDEVWMWGFQYANSEFQKVSRKTARNDCLAIYEAEKKQLKALLEGVNKISLTTDMWKSAHQVAEYMVITGHFIDSGWNLQKRVLSFVKVPAPRRGIDVADAIFKCLKSWGIENKVFSVSVDNASYNDSCLRALKDTLSLSSSLPLGGDLFHVRCCAHILNLMVQDGLGRIRDIIHNVRESVKYINYNDSRLKAFCDVVEQKRLKERKLILDCPTRWNSTYRMLSIALKFKVVFPDYKEREPHYNYAPSEEDWNKVEKICKLLEVFNLATHIISGSEYPTANLYLPEVWRVKQVIDNAIEDGDFFIREMAASMKEKFDKYWGECNMLMAIASVLDPRCKLYVVNYCFPLIYKPDYVASENIDKVVSALRSMYDEYVSMYKGDTMGNNEVDNAGNNSSADASGSSIVTGFDQIMSIVREKQAVPPMKSELEAYLEDGVYIPDGNSNSFSALEWWKNNSMKYKILSKMAADILAIPISTVASESTFSAGGRVIDEYRSKLNEESIEVLICGGDWLRNKYGLRKKPKVLEQDEEIILKFDDLLLVAILLKLVCNVVVLDHKWPVSACLKT